MSERRQRLDVWLHRARLVQSRAAAASLIEQGAVRVFRDGLGSRSIAKPSAEIGVGDYLILPVQGRVLALEVLGLSARRGPSAEARALYSERDAEPSA